MVNWWYSARVPSTFLLIISLSQGLKPYCLTVRCLWNSWAIWVNLICLSFSCILLLSLSASSRRAARHNSRRCFLSSSSACCSASFLAIAAAFSSASFLSWKSFICARFSDLAASLSLSHSFQKVRRLRDNAGRLRWTIFKVFIICRFGHGRAFRTNYFFKLGWLSLYTGIRHSWFQGFALKLSIDFFWVIR